METATEKFYTDKIAELGTQLENYKGSMETYRQNYYTASSNNSILINAMKEWTLENLSNGTISEDTAQEIADICGFELITDFDVQVNVTYYLTIQARDRESAQEVVDMTDFESISYDSDSIYSLSATVDSVDF